jgi:hypothetical protein
VPEGGVGTVAEAGIVIEPESMSAPAASRKRALPVLSISDGLAAMRSREPCSVVPSATANIVSANPSAVTDDSMTCAATEAGSAAAAGACIPRAAETSSSR